MSRIVLLDSGPLGIVTNPKAASPLYQEGKLWLQSLPLKRVNDRGVRPGRVRQLEHAPLTWETLIY